MKNLFLSIIFIFFSITKVNAMTIVCEHSGEKFDYMFTLDGNETFAYVLEGNKDTGIGEVKRTKTPEGWIFELTNMYQGQKETMTWDVNLRKKSGLFKMNLVGKKKTRKVKCSKLL